jgi:predicted DNA-binding transcriptional regulator AlpA
MVESKKYRETLEKLESMFPNKLLLDVKDLANVTGLSVKTIYVKVAPGCKRKKLGIEPVRHSRRHLRFKIHDVARFISAGL